MRKNYFIALLFFCGLLFTACNNSKTSAASAGKKWCELNGKLNKASEGDERQAAQKELIQYEKELEDKYKDDKEFISEMQKEAEKCEAASEGR